MVSWKISSLALLFALLIPALVTAQSIGGTVTDATGAVLPGVTVEARSPALIEQARSVVTEGNGAYLIVALEPGTYFTLQAMKKDKVKLYWTNSGTDKPRTLAGK